MRGRCRWDGRRWCDRGICCIKVLLMIKWKLCLFLLQCCFLINFFAGSKTVKFFHRELLSLVFRSCSDLRRNLVRFRAQMQSWGLLAVDWHWTGALLARYRFRFPGRVKCAWVLLLGIFQQKPGHGDGKHRGETSILGRYSQKYVKPHQKPTDDLNFDTRLDYRLHLY